MIKRRLRINKALFFALIITLLVFIVLVIFSFVFIHNYSMRIQEDAENKVALSYYSLNEEIRDFKNQNVSLLSGFSAYVQLYDIEGNDEVYEYLDLLLKDHLDDIKNIGVFIDTTIKWVYPLEGNESAIGQDLLKIPSQREQVLRVKNNLETLFVGPVELIQGGTAFIVRMPITKDGTYWGMVSIVLKAEKAFSYVESHSELYKMDYLITSANDPNEVIYGDKNIIEMSPLKFRTDDSIGGWDIYTLPQGGWKVDSFKQTLIFIGSVLISGFISWNVFIWLRRYNVVLSDKVELESKFIHDRFTKIYTREYFNLRVNEEISGSLRHGRAISMVYFDLDHFKEVNDNHGHSVGDEVILEIVKKIKVSIRNEEVFARWGGDEFIILLPNTNLKGAKFVAERIRFDIENLEICQSYGVTASVGCSEWKANEYVQSWFIRTDQALYTSKNTGKNKVTESNHSLDKNILLKVVWDKSSNSGCNRIDDEHRSILEHCNHIVESALDQSSFDDTIRELEIVIREMEEHFNNEIEILKNVSYPNVENHQKIHDALLSKTNSIFQKTIQRDITAVEFFKFLLLTVVEGHFQNEDVKYFPYLIDKQNR
ncbi:diguanylate cyclase [Fusibacter bizertensis]